MITIQGFARLCGCNAQTLRYYDRIGLLAPAKVDEWTGYRYYEEEQAMQFVKIRNLQKAGFSIGEIRPLLKEDDDRLMEAFERKIAEQEQKLERIRSIQRSYLRETMDMQKMVRAITDFVAGRMDDPVLLKEFGMDGAGETEITAKVHELLADWLTQCRTAIEENTVNVDDREALEHVMDVLLGGSREEMTNLFLSMASAEEEPGKDIPADAETVFERNGWEHVREWIGNVPDLSDGKQNFFLFRVREDSPVCDPAFSTLMLAVMDVRCGAMKGGMVCRTIRSGDGLNHFTLLRK